MDAKARANCDVLKASVAAIVQLSVQLIVSVITQNPYTAEYFGDAYRKIGGTAWTKVVLEQGVALATGQTSEILSQQYDHSGLCSRFGGNFDAHNEQHMNELHALLEGAVSRYRGQLAANTESANNGTLAPESGSPSALLDLMFSSTWADEALSLRVLKNPNIIER